MSDIENFKLEFSKVSIFKLNGSAQTPIRLQSASIGRSVSIPKKSSFEDELVTTLTDIHCLVDKRIKLFFI